MPRDEDSIALELLVVRCRLGERAAWDRLVREWEPRLYYFVRRLTVDESEALDVLQQTWLKVYRHLDDLQEPSAFGPWIYRIARNAAFNHRRTLAAYRAALAEERSNATDASMIEATDDEIESRETAEEVHRALQRLPLPQREVLTLHFLEGWDVARIAETLGAPIGTVKSRLFHARLALRKLLSEERDDDSR